jgi:hypothetical protein
MIHIQLLTAIENILLKGIIKALVSVDELPKMIQSIGGNMEVDLKVYLGSMSCDMHSCTN